MYRIIIANIQTIKSMAKEKKKKKENVVQNATLERGRMTYVWESRVPLCLNSDWTWDWVKARTQD